MTLPERTASVPHKQALFDAAVDVVRKQSEDREAERALAARIEAEKKRVSPIVAGGLAVLLGVGIYLAVERPAWLLPEAPRVESAAAQEASLRIGMATTMQRIERFRVAQGRLPRSLAEAGASSDQIGYEMHEGDRYTLRGQNGSVHLTLNSGDPLPPFVGNSFRVLAERSHK